MDGRVQLPVIKYVQRYFDARYVDSITEPGPVRILAGRQNSAEAESIWQRVDISLEKHKSLGVAVVAHHDCAGNPLPKEEQLKQLEKAVSVVREKYSAVQVVGLWVDEQWQVQKIF